MPPRIVLAALLAVAAQPAHAQEAAPDLSRAARGDVRLPGGARRLPGDMREAYRKLSADGEVRSTYLQQMELLCQQQRLVAGMLADAVAAELHRP